MNGRVKFYHHAKGYGFISPEGGGKDVLFHISQVKPDTFEPYDNDAVTFDLVEDTERGKPAAHNVLPV